MKRYWPLHSQHEARQYIASGILSKAEEGFWGRHFHRGDKGCLSDLHNRVSSQNVNEIVKQQH